MHPQTNLIVQSRCSLVVAPHLSLHGFHCDLLCSYLIAEDSTQDIVLTQRLVQPVPNMQ